MQRDLCGTGFVLQRPARPTAWQRYAEHHTPIRGPLGALHHHAGAVPAHGASGVQAHVLAAQDAVSVQAEILQCDFWPLDELLVIGQVFCEICAAQPHNPHHEEEKDRCDQHHEQQINGRCTSNKSCRTQYRSDFIFLPTYGPH